jgi:hypothetical protein
MGSDMTNLKNSNLKVPPLKIVLSSATSGGSDRSTSTSPSSGSESLDSNLTIISENQQERSHRSEQKEEHVHGKFDKVSRHSSKGNGGAGSCSGTDQKNSNATQNATIVSVNKRPNQDNNSDNNFESTATTKESTSSNQRITRSSQRAAQQNKSENSNETNGDDTNLADNQDKSNSELGQRKVKRRKAEQIDALEESNQQVQQQPVVMANICPADYQLPSQNSFELYRDIRNRPYMKMMKLNLLPPKVPHGFKDYIIYGGPYLLEGNKVGLGLSGGKVDPSDARMNSGRKHPCLGAKAKLSSNFQKRLSLNQSSFNQRHSSYTIPKLLEAPKSLKLGSPLYELFQDQEKARQRMRMQHLKERERSVLTSEQEILRAYNQATIADNQQTLHLSACTYFYYQEKYHYIDEKSNYLDCINHKDSSSQARESSDPSNAENSNGGEKLQTKHDEPSSNTVKTTNSGTSDKARHSNDAEDTKDHGGSDAGQLSNGSDARHSSKKKKGGQENEDRVEVINDSKNACDIEPGKKVKGDESGTKEHDSNNSDDKTMSGTVSIEENSTENKTEAQGSVMVSELGLKEANKEAFLNNLQEIDNKWAKIKNEMFIRHKNESDSLYAVQCLEWEWKAKETGACDVRLSLKVDPEFVPRVVVSALDY